MFHAARYGPYPLLNTEIATSGREEIWTTSQEEVETAINRAQKAFDSGSWSKASTFARAKVLTNLARILESRLPEMTTIESLQTGRTIREMRAQLGRLPEWMCVLSAPTQGPLLNYVQRVPLGVVAQITPFNHPLLIAIKKIAPALAAGNSVIVKPSEWAPITVLEFAKMAEEAGVPAGVLTVLPGFGQTTGKAIISSPFIRKVDVTAGTQTGRVMGSIVGSNLASFTAELGGKVRLGSNRHFNDADPVAAVNGAAFASFVASGQTCVSGTRLIIQDGIYDAFMNHFLKKVESIYRRMGDPINPKSTMGTVISPQSLSRIEGMMSRTKGKVIFGGQRMTGKSELDNFDFSQGSFFPPTVVVDVDTSDELWVEEVFGPVVVVKRFSTEGEGVTLANACKYGLGAGIWTSNLSRAHRVAADIQTGLCWVNTHHRNDPSSPWGGMKESGIGRENGLEAFESYSQSKSTIVNIAPAETTRITDDWFSEEPEGKRYG
ncbi:aldehyde dehydrogenase [Armillaria borealis]|uniref:Aldehyde dehydrogenase n=1 Tax=Armillaria borealis TaxID=47425 RepID=A0AA39K5L0_9AGAR|nr:aldehyde dehydrogenase [Armillaria borealis]